MHDVKMVLVVGVIFLGAACGDDASSAAVDGGTRDGGSDTSAIAFVVVGDRSAGAGIASVVDIASLQVQQNVVAGVVGSDSVVRLIDDELYVINRRGGNNVTILDSTTYQLIAQISTGDGSNPNDVAVRGSTIYASATSGTGVVVLDADRPQAGVMRTIDLSSMDPDGFPNCSSMYLAGDTLLVACSILDEENTPRGPAKIAVIDTTTNTFTGSFELATRNPFNPLLATPAAGPLGGDLLLGTVVDFYSPATDSGCIERISLSPTPSSAGCLVSNVELGGFATAYYMVSDDLLYVAVTSGFDSDGAIAQIKAYDMTTGNVLSVPVTDSAQRIYDFVVCPTGEIVGVDRLGGLRVYGPDGSELTTGLLDIGLPPRAYGTVVCY